MKRILLFLPLNSCQFTSFDVYMITIFPLAIEIVEGNRNNSVELQLCLKLCCLVHTCMVHYKVNEYNVDRSFENQQYAIPGM